jgi:hypothetical protein
MPLMDAYLGVLNGARYVALSNLASITGQLVYAYEVSQPHKNTVSSSDFLTAVQ